MTDTVDSKTRSRVMARVRSKDTRPEMIVRRLIHNAGYRYRLHDKTLPGTPDLVFRKRRKVIFVHGCFWHRHKGCPLARMPKSRTDFWKQKLEANKARDKRQQAELIRMGWDILIIWECEMRSPDKLLSRIMGFLDDHHSAIKAQ